MIFKSKAVINRQTATLITLLIFVFVAISQWFYNNAASFIILILPICWGIAWVSLNSFKSDLVVITPKNIMLFIWFNKLMVIPLELFLIGNKATLLDSKGSPIYIEVFIIAVSFWSFWAGWGLRKNLKSEYDNRVFENPLIYGILLCAIALLSLIFLYGSLPNYWLNAIFTYATYETLYDAGGSIVGFLANIGQRCWAFGIILLWYAWQLRYPTKKWYWHGIWLIICLLGSLSSNRSNMIYPFVTLLSIMAFEWQLKYKWWLTIIIIVGMFGSLFFGYVRVQPTLDSKDMNHLFDAYLSDIDYIFYAHQLYFGSPYQITPLLHTDYSSSTLLASLLDPIPILGKNFREESGSFIYNMAIYGSMVSQDKVIPMAGELYFNGGWIAVLLSHILFGYCYKLLDQNFKYYLPHNLPLAATILYLSLLFNATLLLSLSVLVQLIIYNAPPAFLIQGIYFSQNSKTFIHNK